MNTVFITRVFLCLCGCICGKNLLIIPTTPPYLNLNLYHYFFYTTTNIEKFSSCTCVVTWHKWKNSNYEHSKHLMNQIDSDVPNTLNAHIFNLKVIQTKSAGLSDFWIIEVMHFIFRRLQLHYLLFSSVFLAFHTILFQLIQDLPQHLPQAKLSFLFTGSLQTFPSIFKQTPQCFNMPL